LHLHCAAAIPRASFEALSVTVRIPRYARDDKNL
jgi:hypothetical protein